MMSDYQEIDTVKEFPELHTVVADELHVAKTKLPCASPTINKYTTLQCLEQKYHFGIPRFVKSGYKIYFNTCEDKGRVYDWYIFGISFSSIDVTFHLLHSEVVIGLDEVFWKKFDDEIIPIENLLFRE